MAQTTDARRAVRPPLESVREAPFALRAANHGEPNDGLTLDGFAAVFGRLTVIDSYEGRFQEQIAQSSMKRSFRETPPKVQFDHGRHPMIGSIPIAELVSITEDVDPVRAPDGGAHVIARLFDNWLIQPMRDAMAAEAINGMSFRFSVVRESWTYADGSPIKDDQALMAELGRCMYGDVPDDELPIRTLKELKVPEIGPVVWPAYADTSVSVRSKVIDLGRIGQRDPEQLKFLARAFFIADTAQPDAMAGRDAAPDDSDDDPAALASGLDAILDQASELIADVDLSTLPPEVAQACALITAAETSADALLEAMGIFDPDDDESSEPADNTGRSKDVDTQQLTGKSSVGERLSHDAQQDTDPVVEHPSPKAAFRRLSDTQRSTFVGERLSLPRRLSDKNLRLRNQRDRLLTLRSIGERSQ